MKTNLDLNISVHSPSAVGSYNTSYRTLLNYHDGIATDLGLKKVLLFEINLYFATKNTKKRKFGPEYLGSQS